MTNTEQTPAATTAPPLIPWPAVSTALIGMFMAVMDGYIVIVAGPAIQADLGATSGQLQWVLAAYQLSYAVFMITAGRIADIVGRRRTFVLGTALFTLTSIACALAPSPEILIVARLLQGLSAAMIVPQVFSMITLMVPAKGRPKLFGVVSVVIAVASVGGQLIGGLLVGFDILGSTWRSVFWINLPLGLLIIALALRYLPETRGTTTRRLDLPGVAVLSVALFLLTFPLIEGREAGWAWWTWVCFAGSALAFSAFAVVERRVERAGKEPLMQLSLFSQRSFSLGLVLVVALYALLTSYYLTLSVSLQEGLGLSALEASLVYAPAPVMFLSFGLLAGKLVPRYGRRVLEVGAIILALGYLATAVALISTGGISLGLLIPTLMLQAVGGGLLITPSLNVVLSRITPETVGMASGALSTAQQVGAALGVAVIGSVFFAAFHPDIDGPAVAATRGFAASSLGVFVIAALTVVLVYLLPKTRPAA